MAKHIFGGDWTSEKLECVRKYLCAYMNIFRNNPRAAFFTTIYVDAFAGTGERVDSIERRTRRAFEEEDLAEAASLQKGSARIALEVAPPFDRFLFIERNPARVKELENLRNDFPDRATAIQIEQGDANQVLQRWCRTSDWQRNRAVVFLDPYGMQVDWATIEAIAETKAIDLWILFPLGMAVNRLLTKHEPPPSHWADALTRFFGSMEWKEEFYPKKKEITLFGEEETERKEANFERIGEYFISRLKKIFAQVATNPLIMMNSKGVPLFLLCFAAGNPKGGPIAVKIAKDILK